ncbi:related to retrotransposon HobS hobase [Claviceps purpurea 20.1]|uniref:Related to retrotransposon HobS hobase n=1 Tax=Claviceps purpurea (strain 20.1) TaxID=1111077 RepID=M1WIP3_CLAP2|nr:related to retrotransposon HobS hobase [Claviceps purpurea 20.1]
MGVRAFIDAIGTRFDPVWARDALSRVSAYSFKVEADTLDNLCADFCRFRASLKTTNIPCDKGVNATLGTRSDQTDNKASRKSKQDHKCPCERPHHPWKPESCRILYMAVTGDKSKGKIGEAKAKRIRETYNDAKFNSLRSNIDKQGWKLKEKEQGKDIPENISAATIDPEMLKQLEVPSGVHATIDMKHPLSNCTLYDSCGALHVVNNPDLLVPGSFKPSDAEDYLESGTSSIAISGRGTRVFKKIFDGKKGPKTIDLTLNDVAVVPNFHVNIVSDSRLLFNVLTYFERWVGRQFGLPIAKYKSDNERAVISEKGDTIFQTWARQEGIDLELTPAYTHEPNGNAERANQTITTKSIAMLKGANLPKDLWPESTRAATHLYNMSPIQRLGWKSPIQVLESWFRDNARLPIRTPTADLRPDWSGLYVYGCRAYPVSRDREADRNRRFYKTNTRGHIGYLVGYVASNIYRIWIPSLKQVISTRNVLFNEFIFYDPSHETTDALTVPEQVDLVRTLDIAAQLEKEINLIRDRGTETPSWFSEVLRSGVNHNIPEASDVIYRPHSDISPPIAQAPTSVMPTHSHEVSMTDAPPLSPPLNPTQSQDVDMTDAPPRQPSSHSVTSQDVTMSDAPSPQPSMSTDIEMTEAPSIVISDPSPTTEVDSIPMTDIQATEATPQAPSVPSTPETTFLKPQSPHAEQRHGLLTPRSSPGAGSDILSSPSSPTQMSTAHHHSENSPPTVPSPDVPEQFAQDTGDDNVRATDDSKNNDRRIERTCSPSETIQGDDNAPTDHPGDSSVTDRQTTYATQDEDVSMSESIADADAFDDFDTDMPDADSAVAKPAPPSSSHTPSTSQKGVATRSRQTRKSRKPASTNSRDSSSISTEIPRRSSRIQKLKKEGRGQDWSILRNRRPDLFLNNFLWDPKLLLETDHLNAIPEELQELRTVFAVIDACCDKNTRSNLKDKILKAPRIHQRDLVREPRFYKEAMKHPLRDHWIYAMVEEITKLKQRETWKQIKRSEAKSQPLPLKWVFTYKFNEENVLERCKARICVRGDLQDKSTIDRTYSATLAAHAFRIFIALVARFDLETIQFDVKNAFLYAWRKANGLPVTCELPDGFKVDGECVELLRALYGLRDSPQLWFEELSSKLKKLGLIPSLEEPCLFYTEARDVFLIFFVDDIIIAYHRDHKDKAEALIAGLKSYFELDDRGEAQFFLGIQIIRDRPNRKIFLSHEAYISKIGDKFNQTNRATFPAIPIPAIDFHKSDSQADKATIKTYQEKIGSILYTAIMIRPDVAFAASKLSQFLTNPSPEHMRAADQVIRYLVLTKHLALSFGHGGMQVIQIASDASFADDQETRRSSQGYLITLFGGPVIWKATRQSTVTTSTTEAELLALQQTAKETMALQRLFKDIKFNTEEDYIIHCDNRQTIRLVLNESERINTRLRHVDIHGMWLKQEFNRGSFMIDYLPTAEMPADGFTKALNRQMFERFRTMLGLTDVQTLNLTATSTKPSITAIDSPTGNDSYAMAQQLR